MKNQPNWPPLIQKRDRYQQGDPTDHLWSKNVTVTNREIQLTTFDPKTLPLPTGRSNWPPLIQKRYRYQQGDPTDHLWSKNVTVTNTGPNRPFRCLDFTVKWIIFIFCQISKEFGTQTELSVSNSSWALEWNFLQQGRTMTSQILHKGRWQNILVVLASLIFLFTWRWSILFC